MYHRRTLKYVFIISCAIAIIYPLVNFYLIFPSFSKISVSNAEDDAIRVAKHLASEVVSNHGELKDPSLYSATVNNAIKDLNLEKLKIFSGDGRVIYSSDPEDIGKLNIKDYFHNIVAKGNIFTNVVRKNSKTLDGRIVTLDVVETYVPIKIGNNFIGAFEIYYDISVKNEALNKVVYRSSLLTFFLMFSFFISLTIILIWNDKQRSYPPLESDSSKLYYSPFNVLFLLAVAIFVAEAIVMFLMGIFPVMTKLEEALMDSALLIMLFSPIVYFFVLHPLLLQVRERHHTEMKLKEAHDDLEKRVLERTTELAESNKQLSEEMAERIKAVTALQESEERYRTLVNSTDDSIYLVDQHCRYLFMNKRHSTRLGVSINEYINKTYSDLHSKDMSKAFESKVQKIFETGRSIQFEYRSDRDGRYFLQTLSPVNDVTGKTFAVSVISKNITDRKIKEEELRTLSLTDELTGTYNRRGFYTHAEQLLKMANRTKDGIFMLYADIDNLKSINDKYGHKEGDRLLFEFSNILKNNYRESDIIARIGGDEFVVIPVGTTEDNIDVINSRFYEALENYNKNSSLKYDISASIGIAFFDPDAPCTLDSLLGRADKQMYSQKKESKK